MKISLNQILFFFLLPVAIFTLHIRHDKVYQSQKYGKSLNDIQAKLKNDLLKIRQIFLNVDKQIKDQVDSNKKLITLQEGIADERDVLYSIETYLNLPFNQRSCQCVNFTDQTKKKISEQITIVEGSLKKVEQKNSGDCKDCKMAKQIQNQIQQQKNYLKVMKDTVNSKCCIVEKTFFVDNTKAAGWNYGSLTPQQYEKFINKSFADKGIHYYKKTCPLETPFVDMKTNTCMDCDSPLNFNLKTRKCQECPIGKIFNFLTRNCDYNKTCLAGAVFNEETNTCQFNQLATNESLCPPNRPIYDPDSFGCYMCPKQTPSFNNVTKKCEACQKDEIWDEINELCRNKNCKVGQHYDQTKQKCEANEKTGSSKNGKTSLSFCPPKTPYWNEESLQCTVCPKETPFFNHTQKKCLSCPGQSKWKQSEEKCMKQCGQGQTLNEAIYVCEKKQSQEENKGQNELSLCPPDKPIWNNESKSCQKCATDKPFYNSKTKECMVCSEKQEWDSSSKKCVQKKPTCSENQVYIAKTNSCEPKTSTSDGVIGICPPENPYYDSQSLSCKKCPSNLPVYDQKLKKCTEKKDNEDKGKGKDQNQDQNKDSNKVSSSNNKPVSCPSNAPIYDSQIKKCVACPIGTIYSEDKKKCEPNKNCPQGQQFNQTASSCRKCNTWELYNKETKKCDKVCKRGDFFNKSEKKCFGTISKCSPGLVYNQDILGCECGQGENYKYNKEKEVCEKFCDEGKVYNRYDDSCQ